MTQDREVTVVVAEMDVTRVNPYRFGQVPTKPVKLGTQCRGAMRDLPLTRWTTSTGPELRRASGMGVRLERTKAESARNTFQCIRSSIVYRVASKL